MKGVGSRGVIPELSFLGHGRAIKKRPGGGRGRGGASRRGVWIRGATRVDDFRKGGERVGNSSVLILKIPKA